MNTTQTQTQTGQHPAFQTLDEEVPVSGLRVEGHLPHWLAGTLVRMTPAGLDVAGRSVRHWFDGLAMLNKFSLAGGQVSYANRYLRTETYRLAHKPGGRRPAGFATDPCRSIFSRIVTTFAPVPADNANINTVRLGNEFLAMTEAAAPIVFEPGTLATLGASERVPGTLTTAHPHHDPAAGGLVNYATHMGRRSRYRVYTRQPGGVGCEKCIRLGVCPWTALKRGSGAWTESAACLVASTVCPSGAGAAKVDCPASTPEVALLRASSVRDGTRPGAGRAAAVLRSGRRAAVLAQQSAQSATPTPGASTGSSIVPSAASTESKAATKLGVAIAEPRLEPRESASRGRSARCRRSRTRWWTR